MYIRAAILVLVLSLTACGGIPFVSKKESKAINPPTALAPLQSTVTLKRVWSRDIGDVERVAGALVPAILGDRVYAAAAAGDVMAIDRASGALVWRVALEKPVTGAVGVAGDLVLVGTRDAEVLALNRETGALQWLARVSSEVLSPPTGAADIVIVRTGDGKVFGIGAGQGDVRWIYERSIPSLTLRGTSAPVIHAGIVYTGFASGKLVANEVSSGRVLWEATVAQPRGRNELERLVDVDARPVVRDGALFTAAYQGRVAALSLQSGSVNWVQDISTNNDLDANGARVFATDQDSRVYGLDRSTGNIAWTQEALLYRALGAPSVLGDFVAATDYQGVIHLLAAGDGALVGRLDSNAKDGVIGTTVADGELYLLDRSGNLGKFVVNAP